MINDNVTNFYTEKSTTLQKKKKTSTLSMHFRSKKEDFTFQRMLENPTLEMHCQGFLE